MMRASSYRPLPLVRHCANSVLNYVKYTRLLLRSHASAAPDASSPTVMKTPLTPPKLFEVPALPFLGSLITMHSGHPSPNLEHPYLYAPSCRKKYGDFYSLVSFSDCPLNIFFFIETYKLWVSILVSFTHLHFTCSSTSCSSDGVGAARIWSWTLCTSLLPNRCQ
jgi:hypothetical protein